jgi:N utilization substance protein B
MKRRSARIVAVQCLYQMEMSQVPPFEALKVIMEEVLGENEAGMVVTDPDEMLEYVRKLLLDIVPKIPEIDQLLSKFLEGYQLDRLSRVDKEVLRLGAYELIYRSDIPPKVAVNEAVEVAKYFGSQESGRFVNGVLGKMIKQVDALKESVNP